MPSRRLKNISPVIRNYSALIALVILLFSVSVQAKDKWTEVRSKNFYLIGNASEKDIRHVAARLEQFRETFRLLFAGLNLTSPIPTNVIVFKGDGALRPFKPKRADGKIDDLTAGYFQTGPDVNYIALPVGRDDADTFRTIYHEYVHFIVNSNFGKSDVPPWFNEGLAEYYSTFQIEKDQVVKLGLPISEHLQLMNMTQLMPLRDLFNVSNFQLHQTGSHSRNIFYAESWVLIHYLISSGKGSALAKFLDAVIKGTAPEKAFSDAFQIGYAQMDVELRKYVQQKQFKYTNYTFNSPLTSYADASAAELGEPESNAYLGDLLYHIDRADDAEPFLAAALAGHPNLSMANTTLGMVKMKQRKWDEAKRYLESAIAGDAKNHHALFSYAYLLSREGRDEFGFVQRFPAEDAEKMRSALRKAIALNPEFTESYELMAFVDLVNHENLDEAVTLLQQALKYQPGNQHYAIRIAEIYAAQEKYAEAAAAAEKIARTSDEADIRERATQLAENVRNLRQARQRQADALKRYEQSQSGGGSTTPRFGVPGKPMTEAEITRAASDSQLRSINSALRIPAEDEKRVLGRVQKIDCKSRPIVFTIKTPTEALTVTSRDFDSLNLNAFVAAANHVQVGCDANISAFNALATYRAAPAKGGSRGELTSIEFVPDDFRIMTADELSQPPPRIVPGDAVDESGAALPEKPVPGNQQGDFAEQRRAAMLQAITTQLAQPGPGEKRDIGYLEKIDCSGRSAVFVIRTASQTLRLLNSSPQSLKIRVFVSDLGGIQFGCTLRPIEYPAVFTYRDAPDTKLKSAGEILTLDFVPKSFTLP